MNITRLVRTICVANLPLAAALSGCAVDSQSTDESLGSSKQAWTTVPGDAGFASSIWPPGNGNANSNFSYNSSGATNLFTHLGTGQYRVDLPNLGTEPSGHVEVSAVSSGNRRCKVQNWYPAGTTMQVWVLCFDGGALADTDFTVSFVRRNDTPGPQGAYVWAFDAQSSSYDAVSSYSWNSTGGGITITHAPGTGNYWVEFSDQDMSGGTVEVTAYGSSSSYCKVTSWGGNTAGVKCFDGATGEPIESNFDLLFNSKQPNGTPSSSYLWADQPTASSYHPSSNYALGLINVDYSSNASVISTAPTITRRATGLYSVTFPDMAADRSFPFTVKVTGYGSDSDTCKAWDWSIIGSDANVEVTCWDASGNPIDAFYTITFSSFAFTIG